MCQRERNLGICRCAHLQARDAQRSWVPTQDEHSGPQFRALPATTLPLTCRLTLCRRALFCSQGVASWGRGHIRHKTNLPYFEAEHDECGSGTCLQFRDLKARPRIWVLEDEQNRKGQTRRGGRTSEKREQRHRGGWKEEPLTSIYLYQWVLSAQSGSPFGCWVGLP